MGLIRKIFGIEKRATLREPPDWLSASMIGGEPSATGLTVSPDSALTVATYFAAIRVLSEDVGKLPWLLYRKLKPRGKARADSHPLFPLLHDSPNPEMSSQSFREVMMTLALGRGNGYAEISRNTQGRPTALWVLDSDRVSVERDKARRIVYRVRPAGGGEAVMFPPHDVFHLRGAVSTDGITGLSIATQARESIGLGMALERYGAAFFGNGASIGTIFKFPHALSPKAREQFAEVIREQREGLANAHKSLILENGGDVTRTSITNEDSQFLESMRFSTETIARWFRVPQHKLGILDKATYSNIDRIEQQYFADSILPWLRRFESEVQRKLLPERTDLFSEILTEGALRADVQTRFAAYGLALEHGWLSVNEIRELENRNPIDGGDEMAPLPRPQTASESAR